MRILLLCVGLLFVAPPSQGFGFDSDLRSDEITAVSSRVFNGYKRVRLSDGSLRPESYGFGIGGPIASVPVLSGEGAPPTRDVSVDDVSFTSIARSIQGPLASQRYEPTGEPRNADLLIVVFWGRSTGSGAFSGSDIGNASGADKDKIDAQNAKLLGFGGERVFDAGFNDPSNMMMNIRKQLYSGIISAVEDDRYFVILQAFDFQAAWRHRKIRLLWETRFSLSERRHDFRKDLPRMAQNASEYFGQDSHGLVNRAVPRGRVDVGEVESLGALPEK